MNIDTNRAIDNIIDLFNQASVCDIYAGSHWYHTANNIARLYSYVYDIPLIQVCAVISCLSPRVRWESNIAAADMLLDSFVNDGVDGALQVAIPGFYRNKRKAITLLNDFDALRKFYQVDKTSGHKTAHFANNILLYNDDRFVTVDGHAVNIALGTIGVKYSGLSKKQYNQFVEAYRTAAQHSNLLSCDLQAITWITYKRINNI